MTKNTCDIVHHDVLCQYVKHPKNWQQTMIDNKQITKEKLYIVNHCLKEQRLNRELIDYRFVIVPDWQKTTAPQGIYNR